ncbi:MAG: hypothetical protein IKK57_07885 [Clostridia bacterium]|nr:hypothetical protein [Clostridia bacterium]
MEMAVPVLMGLMALTAAVQVYVLMRLPAPGMAGATGKLRRQPGGVAVAVTTALMLLSVLGFAAAGLLQDGSGWRVALILWAGMLLFLFLGASLAFDGVTYGPEGFALRDGLGRARTYRWADVLAAEALIIPRRGRSFDMEITAIYLPDRTLTLRRTLEATFLLQRPFLTLLREKRPDLPDGNPDDRRVYSPAPSLVTACLIELFLCAFAVAGMEDVPRNGWLWIPAGMGAVYVLLIAAVAVWPQCFSAHMQEMLLGPEPRRKA